MNDEWRVHTQLHHPSHAERLLGRLEAEELEHDLSSAFHDRVIVSRDGSEVFLYAASREQAEKARGVVSTLASEHGWSLDVDLRRWHPIAEEWEDPDRPLPEGKAAEKSEHEELMATEREETEQRGTPEVEVRVDLPSRHDALRFAEQLKGEGWPVVHRWRFLLVGASDEDSAKTIAERIRGEAPEGSRVSVEGTWAMAYAESPHPPKAFAVFGGLAQ